MEWVPRHEAVLDCLDEDANFGLQAKFSLLSVNEVIMLTSIHQID